MPQANALLRLIPSVDRLLASANAQPLLELSGRERVVAAYRQASDEVRQQLTNAEEATAATVQQRLHRRASEIVHADLQPSLRKVFNLTGTVLHTNLGRAPLPTVSVEAMLTIAQDASNLEYDLDTGQRGQRDHHIQRRLCELTGAEAATVVNNNAAAVMLTLNTVADQQDVAVSRSELIEIGDSFRIPDIMAKSGCRLYEVGTTNRTHEYDYRNALDNGAVAIMRVHASNFSIHGFTSSVPVKTLANLAAAENACFINDLGSGALIDLTTYGLPNEPTATRAIADGADIVTFSGDKLLGGPQCGLIVGRQAWIERINRNPMKRALRCDKLTLAALDSLLTLYMNPAQLHQTVPALRLLTRAVEEITQTAKAVAPAVSVLLSGKAVVDIKPCESQVGSGAQPTERIPSVALVITPRESGGTALQKMAEDFRKLSVPVITRTHDDALWLDMRCLEDPDAFINNLQTSTMRC